MNLNIARLCEPERISKQIHDNLSECARVYTERAGIGRPNIQKNLDRDGVISRIWAGCQRGTSMVRETRVISLYYVVRLRRKYRAKTNKNTLHDLFGEPVELGN